MDRADELQRIAGVERWSERDAGVALRAWRRSGRELEEFARDHGLASHRLRWWKQKLGLAEQSLAGRRSGTKRGVESASRGLELVPAVIVGGGGGDAVVVVRLPDGIEIELRDAEHTSASEVARLVAELRRSGS